MLLRNFLLSLIKGYQYFISPLLGPRCRFHPSCSNYAAESFKKFSIPVALWYSCRRICKCHPFHPGGHDPVPDTCSLEC